MGCDPGSSGCIILLHRDGSFVKEIRMDQTLQDIGFTLRQYRKEISFGFIERVHSMPKQGVASSFKFGTSFGVIIGMVAICGIRHEFIQPQKWQASLKCLTKGDKNVSKARAQQLFPAVKVIHQNADALLIAEWARQTGIERGY